MENNLSPELQFYNELMQVQAELPQIPKNREAKVQTQRGSYSYRYADLATILKIIFPILHKHGFVLVSFPSFTDDEVVVETVLRHVGGHKESVSVRLKRGSTPQDTGSAITYARRYGIQCLLGFAADEDDDAMVVTDSVRSNEIEQISAMLDEAEAIEPGVRRKFMQHFKIADLHELNGESIRLAKKLLTAKLESLRKNS
ncbi:MAG: ERF family protein [Candidatus Methanomethylicaceae archaeon]